MNVERIKMSKLNPAKYNPRKDLKPGDTEYEKLKRSMAEFLGMSNRLSGTNEQAILWEVIKGTKSSKI